MTGSGQKSMKTSSIIQIMILLKSLERSLSMIKRPKFIGLTIVFITAAALIIPLGISTLEVSLHTTTFQMEEHQK